MQNLKHLTKIINSYPADIKAEVLVADLVREGFESNYLVVFYRSLFKRRYSRDILNAEIITIDDYHESLALYLARDGLYDLLPEGLFHESKEAALISGREMALNSKRELKVEEEARKFFRPIENEFFYQRVQIELEERSMLQKLQDNHLEDFFMNFWKIDPGLPRELSVKLVSMLPFLKEIVGDFAMTASCLAGILGEEVRYSVEYTTRPPVEAGEMLQVEEFPLGYGCLGVDTVTSGHVMESCKVVRFQIGPLKKTKIEPYLANGEIARFIASFFSYFMPLEIEAEYEVFIQEDRQEFVLNPENQAIMGYSTII